EPIRDPERKPEGNDRFLVRERSLGQGYLPAELLCMLVSNTSQQHVVGMGKPRNDPSNKARSTGRPVAFESDPGFSSVHGNIAVVYARQGKYAEALAEYDKIREVPDVRVQWFRAWVYALSGRRGESLELVRSLEDRSRREHVSHAALGQL